MNNKTLTERRLARTEALRCDFDVEVDDALLCFEEGNKEGCAYHKEAANTIWKRISNLVDGWLG